LVFAFALAVVDLSAELLFGSLAVGNLITCQARDASRSHFFSCQDFRQGWIDVLLSVSASFVHKHSKVVLNFGNLRLWGVGMARAYGERSKLKILLLRLRSGHAHLFYFFVAWVRLVEVDGVFVLVPPEQCFVISSRTWHYDASCVSRRIPLASHWICIRRQLLLRTL